MSRPNRPNFAPRQGSGYLVVIIFAAILLIFMVMLFRVRSGQLSLMSKSAKDYLANSLAEGGIHAVLSELRLDPDYRTHELYRPASEDPWHKPIKNRPSHLDGFQDFYFDGVKNGVYTGGNRMGRFKIRLAKVFGKNDTETQTVKENMMLLRIEALAHVGAGKRPEDDSYRRIWGYFEKRSPATEFLLFDGEVLDLGYGPYEETANIFSRGRLYGYQWLSLPAIGTADKGSELVKVEKVESPGMISAPKETRLTFPNTKTLTINVTNDSSSPNRFSTMNGYVLDGSTGAHPIKLTHLPKEYLLAKAKRKGNGGFIIEANTFAPSKWQNPYDPGTKYVDLDFGEFRLGQEAAETEPGEEEDPGNPDDDNDSSPPPTGSDDPDSIRSTPGKRLLIYSKVPLRIWGCPDRTITIFSEKDIVISGDFNQNPETPQDYPDATYQTYKTTVKNGKKFHKAGALIMSDMRIIIDISRPSLFAKNELKPFFLYQLAMALDPNATNFPDILAETRRNLCPLDPAKRKEIKGKVGSLQAYNSLIWLHNHPSVNTGEVYEDCLRPIIALFTPSADGQPHFGIKDPEKRQALVAEVEKNCRDDGVLTITELDRLFDLAWTQAILEEAEDPDPTSGPMGLMNALFEVAQEDFQDGLFGPEITINAALISSARRSAPWTHGSVSGSAVNSSKVFDEIGNCSGSEYGIVEYLKKPGFVIQRVYGSDVRLGSRDPGYFITGKYTGGNILRRRLWDRTLTGGNYQPSGLPFAFNMLTYRDESASKKEFDNF
jgi:hypothetical protein